MKLIALILSLFTLASTPIHDLKINHTSSLNFDTKESKLFARFLSHFEKTDKLPEIDHTKIQNYKTKYLQEHLTALDIRFLAMDLRKFIPELKTAIFRRMGPPIVEPLNRFYLNENMVAVTYLMRNRYNESGFSVSMTLYDLKGENITKTSVEKGWLIQSFLLGGFTPLQTILCSVSSPNVVTVNTYNNIWEKDVEEYGFEENDISCYEKKISRNYIIQPNGEIEIIELQEEIASLK